MYIHFRWFSWYKRVTISVSLYSSRIWSSLHQWNKKYFQFHYIYEAKSFIWRPVFLYVWAPEQKAAHGQFPVYFLVILHISITHDLHSYLSRDIRWVYVHTQIIRFMVFIQKSKLGKWRYMKINQFIVYICYIWHRNSHVENTLLQLFNLLYYYFNFLYYYLAKM